MRSQHSLEEIAEIHLLLEDIKKEYDVYPNSTLNKDTYDGIIIAVAHDKFKIMGIEAIHKLCKKDHIIYDLKYLFSKDQVDLRL